MIWTIRFPYEIKGRLFIPKDDPHPDPDESPSRKLGETWPEKEREIRLWVHMTIEAPSIEEARKEKEENYAELQEAANKWVRANYPDHEIFWPK